MKLLKLVSRHDTYRTWYISFGTNLLQIGAPHDKHGGFDMEHVTFVVEMTYELSRHALNVKNLSLNYKHGLKRTDTSPTYL